MSTRVSYIEIDIPVCSLVYGEAPCTAQVGVTGEIKCFNTLATCQDPDNIDKETQTLRLSTPTLRLNPSLNSLPCINEVSHTPGRLDLGNSIGARAVLTITCRDFPFPDTGVGGDKYRSDRDYDPYEQGTFWGKMRARQPWLRGAPLRWYIGSDEDDIPAMEMRSYIIDTVAGPNTDGAVTITAKDPFGLLDNKRAIAPRITTGQIPAGGLSDSATSFIIAMPTGADVDNEYPLSGYLAIGGNEVVSYTRDDTLFTIQRGLFNTEAVEHESGDRVQLCLYYSPQNPADIMYDLLVTYGGIDSSYIPLSTWESEIDAFYDFPLSGMIAEPTPVADLINELLEQICATMWWSEVNAQLVFRVVRSVSQSAYVYDDNVILAGSFRQKVLEDKRVSQVWTYYGQISPLAGQEDSSNYRVSLASVNLKSESIHGSPSVKKIYSRWISQFAINNAGRLNALILSRFSTPPREFMLSILRMPLIDPPSTGVGVRVQSFLLQDPTGAPLIRPTQITEVETSSSVWNVRAEEVIIDEEIEAPVGIQKILPITTNINNFNMRSAYLDTYNEAEPGDEVICQIAPNVVLGSTSTTLPAFDTGEGWPEGVTLKLVIQDGAFIVGRGGRGGGANSSSGASTSQGGAGGDAVRVRVPIEITNEGVIGGGGGGGASAAAYADGRNLIFVRITARAASSGGGGAGFGAGGSSNRVVGSAGGLEVGGTTSLSSEESRGTIGLNACYAQALGNRGGALGQQGFHQAGVLASANTDRSSVERTSTSPGGPPGRAVVGESFVTWIAQGDIRGIMT